MPIPSIDNNKVAILMGTFQGSEYILEQLDSFKSQTYQNWALYVSDDGSTDDTIAKIVRFSSDNKLDVTFFKGPQQGFVSNFLSLLSRDDVDADYYSFSDQDDVWHSDKLERAVKWLATQPTDKPALYCSRTHIINSKGESLGYSASFSGKPSFSNALIQSIAGGNTMVLNKAARNVICNAGIVDVISHDWWIYVLMAGVGGVIYYDENPTLDYRQHAANIIGFDSASKRRLSKIKALLQGQIRPWNAAHIVALKDNSTLLTAENKKKFKWFKKVHNANLFVRTFYYFKLRLYRPSIIDNLSIFLLVQLKKI